MTEQSERPWRKSVALLVAAVMVLSMVVGVIAFLPASASGSVTAASAPVAPAASGPITPLANSASGLSPNGPSVLGQYTVLPQASVPAGASPLPSAVTATVTLNPSQSLSTFINELNNPNNPAYRHFLTIGQFGSEFGSSSYASVVNYFEGYGLSVQLSSGLLSLTVSGTPSQMSAAFHTTITPFAREYQSQGMWNPLYGNGSAVAGSTTYAPGFYANTQPLALPASISGAISGVAGLAGLTAQPSIVAPLNLGPGQNLAALEEAYNASHPGSLQSVPYTGPAGPNTYGLDQIQGLAGANYTWAPGDPFSFDCSFFGIGCTASQTLFPSTLHAMTGASNLWSGSTTIASEPDMGQGVTIALVEVGCLDTGTIQSFSNQVWTNPSQPGTPLVNRITQIGLNTPGAFFPNNNYNGCMFNGLFNGWTIETALDVEYAATMAPMAHIDIVAAGSADFSAFNTVFSDVAQYLSQGQTTLPASVGTVVAVGAQPVSTQTLPPGAGSISITSNSYGEGEEYAAFYGSPMYLTVENTLLEQLNAVGVTNFFASGDYSGAEYLAANQAGMPAISPGSTSVGGGQTTAESNGLVFPVTNNVVCPSGYSYAGNGLCIPTGLPSYYCNYGFCVPASFVAPATGLASFTYWSYGFGIGGTYQGAVGGGFGQSIGEQQPWYQNALDTYSTGAAIDPVVSGPAAFNMTIYEQYFGGWLENYGGTSFATPTTAGMWALIEEQANVAYGTPKMGDINPMLYAAHNANEAGVSSFSANPFTDMTAMGTGFDWGPINSFNWYYFNLSIEQPYDPVLPWWFNGLLNPAGSGWNYLQGLGMIQVDTLAAELIGQTGEPGFALTNPAFQVEVVTSGGTLMPMSSETLVGGQTYTLEVITTGGQPGIFNVAAYSGGANDGTYGGGMVTTLQTNSHGRFTYTPTYTQPATEVTNGTEYGYFLVTSVAGQEWSFAPYAVAQPAASGTLSLCVSDVNDICQTSIAEVTTFTTGYTGFYNIYPEGFATLNGVPVPNALVTETSVNVALFQNIDPTMPLSSYAPGATLGTYLSGGSGEFNFWTNAFTAETNGYLPTQVVTLTATYDGLTSNTVTVFIEPQSGSFNTQDLTMTSGSTTTSGAVTGVLTFSGMKDVNYVNVSIGGSPGQYQNTTYPPTFYDSNNGVYVSGVFNGQIPVDLSTAGITGPIQISMVAGGTNDLSFGYCFFGFCFESQSVNQITWSDPIVFLPATLTSSAGTQTVTGNDTFTFAGTSYPGATGTLALEWAGGSEVLASGISGSYTLNTATLMDGAYSVVFTETVAGLTSTTRTVNLYADNEAASLSQLVKTLNGELASDQATITADQATITSLNGQVTSLSGQVSNLQGELNTANANIATLQGQVSSLSAQVTTLTGTVSTLKGQVSTLTSELSTAQGQVSSLTAQVSSLEAQLSASQGNTSAEQAQLANVQAQLTAAKQTIAQDQATINADQGTISTDTASIATLNAKVTQLQNELSSKKGTVAPLWFNSIGSLGVIAIIALVGAVVGLTAYVGGRRANRKTGTANPPSSGPVPQTPANLASEPSASTSSAGRKAALDDAMTEAFRRSLVTTLQASVATQKTLLGQGRVEDAMRLNARAREVAQEALTYFR